MTRMGTDDDTTQASTVDAGSRFPRLELPPVPSFGRVATPDGEVTPLRDEPLWTSPYAQQVDPELQYRAMVERVASLAPAPAPVMAEPELRSEPTPAPAPTAPTPGPYVMPELATEPPVVPAAPSVAVAAIFLVLAALLVWASRMAFSPGLLALSGLLVAQLAAARAAAPSPGRLPLLLAGAAAALALLATKGALGGFSDMAMVAGLFVIAASLPTLVGLGIAQLLLRRRAANASPVDEALRGAWQLRFGALLALVVAAVMVRDSFSARPDAFVTFGIVALVALTLVPVLRRSR